MRTFLFIILCIITGPGPLRAGIITVAQDGSGDLTSVQEGIDMAASGDTVLVEQGIYMEPLFIEKPLTLASRYIFDNDEDHIHNTILDGNNAFRLIYINQAEDVNIHGLTIQNGLNTYPDELKIKYTIFRKEKAVNIDTGLKGAGIFAEISSGKIIDCIIKNNKALSGAGLFLWDHSNFSLKGCVIKKNHSFGMAGGIFASFESTFTFDSINRCSVYLNTGGNTSSDILFKENMAGSIIYLDTATVAYPSRYYINCIDNYLNHIPDYEVDVNAGKIEQVTSDLYVDPATGSNSNTGTTPDEPLKNLWFALLKMKSGQSSPLTIHLAEGEYAPSLNNERFPAFVKDEINIIGAARESTIINNEHISGAFSLSHLYGNNELKNMTIINGGERLNRVHGQIYIYETKNILIENVTINNYESDYVRGISAARIDTLIVNNTIVKNGMGGYGINILGHLEGGNTYARLESVKVNNIGPNTEPDQAGTGGGIAISNASYPDDLIADLINCEITDNVSNETAWTMASGLFINGHPKVFLHNSTIAGNVSYNDAAVTVAGASSLYMFNSIVYGNAPNEIIMKYDEAKPGLHVNYSDIRDGEDGIVFEGTANVYWNEGNIDIDPVFTTYNGTDYFLAQNSSCIHAGTIDIDDFTFPEHDLMGNPRIHGIVDMGAYENPFVPVSTNDLPGLTNNVRVSPNPADGIVSVTVTLKKTDNCILEIFNNKGEHIRHLFDGKLTKGTHMFYLNKAGQLPAGVYLYTFKTGSTIKNGKIVIE